LTVGYPLLAFCPAMVESWVANAAVLEGRRRQKLARLPGVVDKLDSQAG
jgi:hypothetical protein